MFKRSLYLATGALFLAGCASTTIYPEGENKFSLVATSSSEGSAEKAAEKKASDYCEKMGKKLVVLKHQSTYQGVDRNQKAVIGLASALVGGGPNPASSSDDYRVELKFKCS